MIQQQEESENKSQLKSNKENVSNNFSSHKSEKKSQPNSNNSIQELEKNIQPLKDESTDYVFKVIKLGRRGFSHKERILKLSREGIEYYCMPDNNRFTKEFYESLEKIYTSKSFEDKTLGKFKTLADIFNRIPENEKKLKNSFDNYILNPTDSDSSTQRGCTFTVYNASKKDYTNADNFWIMDAGEEIIRNHIFRASSKILQNLDEPKIKKEFNRRQIKLNRTDNNNTRKEETQKDKLSTDKMLILNDYKDKIKYIGIMYQGFMKEYLKAISDFNKKKRESFDKMGYKNPSEHDNQFSQFFPLVNEVKGQIKIARLRKYTEMNMKNENSKEEFSDNARDKDIIDPIKDQINDTLKIAYLELAIYHFYDMFIKYCEKVVEKIVANLYSFDKADDILNKGKLHPIVFPNPSNFTQILNDNDDKMDETCEPVLLYSVWGVNYTLTWHRLTYKFGETVGTSGNWKRVKHQFQQKNYFQDLLIRLASISDDVDNFPCIPMSCVIDYNGFRVYCEADIFASEEYLEGMRLQINKKDMEFLSNIISLISENNNEDSKKIENSDIYCKIKSEYIADERGFQLSQYIKTMIDDFLKSFNNNTQGSIVNDIKKVDPFTEMQSQRPIINSISRLITEDRTIMGDDKKQFEDFENESVEFQKNCAFQYLMYFDVLIPIDPNKRKNETVYYRQELAINNIDLREEIKQSHPKFFRNEDYDFEESSEYNNLGVNNIEEQSNKNSSENDNNSQTKKNTTKRIEDLKKKI